MRKAVLPVLLFMRSLNDAFLKQRIEARIQQILLKAIPWNDDCVGGDDQSDMFHGKDNGIVSDEDFA